MEFSVPLLGAAAFGAVVGWMANHVLERTTAVDVKWLGSMIAVIGGGAVTALFKPRSEFFGWYAIGLAVMFFMRVVGLPFVRWFGGILKNETAKLDAE